MYCRSTISDGALRDPNTFYLTADYSLAIRFENNGVGSTGTV